MAVSQSRYWSGASGKKVILIEMPWTDLTEPSLGLGILKSILNQAGIECTIVEAQIYLLKWVTSDTYQQLSERWAVNDWLFTGELYPKTFAHPVDTGLLNQALKKDTRVRQTSVDDDELREKALRVRDVAVPAYLSYLMEIVDFSDCALVGFTCLTDQTFASLALAKRIKEKHPGLPIAFGGYNLTAPTGPHLQAMFPELMDIVAYGDGETTIVPIFEAARGQRSLDSVPSISYRSATGEIVFTAKQQCDLNESPAPNYDDYVAIWNRMKEHEQIETVLEDLPFETSRGCWWGQKNHCTFCGIDDEALRYRTKTPRVALAQLDDLNRRYGMTTFRASDYIFPHTYYGDFLAQCKERGAPYRFKYEMKANLTEDKVVALKDAGVYWVQLGVESFSTPVLKRMRKGVTALQNIYSVYALSTLGIYPYYNLLYGFPGDQVHEYHTMLLRMTRIRHLLPAGSCISTQVTRFAPYGERPYEFYPHVKTLSHHPYYDLLFPKAYLEHTGLDMDKVCYYFENYLEANYSDELMASYLLVENSHYEWRLQYYNDDEFPKLYYETDLDSITFRDERRVGDHRDYQMDGLAASVYEELTHGPITARRVGEALDGKIPEKSIRTILDEFEAYGLALRENDNYLGIAFPEIVYRENRFTWRKPATTQPVAPISC